MAVNAFPVGSRRKDSRCAVSNGSRVLTGVDGRSATARRFKDLIENFARDLGGIEDLTEAEHSLVRQAAGLTIEAERLQAQIVKGEPTDTDQLIRLTNTARRILQGIRKREKPKPTLQDYLSRRREAAA
jgi:hypothetical protein